MPETKTGPNAIDQEFHATECRCDDCKDWLHSHHYDTATGEPTLVLSCTLCYPPFGMHHPQHPIIRDEVCTACEGSPRRRLTGKTRTINERQDPTEAYELECGHWVI